MIKTKRLILRPWREEDFEPFAKMNADPRVREFYPAVLTREESDLQGKAHAEGILKNGYGFWAVTIPGIAEFAGMIGINPIAWQAHFTPAIEIGWRLPYEFWGYGYATEGAKAALEFGFNTVNLEQIVALTAVDNIRSRHIMDKLGMTHDPKDDFDHPRVPPGNKVRRHVLYRINR